MQDRFHPKTLLHELRRYGPDWAEKFPQVPDLLFQAADQIRQLDKVLPALEQNARENKRYAFSGRTHYGRWSGLAVLLVAVAIAGPDATNVLSNLPLTSVLFGAAGLYMLLRR